MLRLSSVLGITTRVRPTPSEPLAEAEYPAAE
jgi:hypothetical protein